MHLLSKHSKQIAKNEENRRFIFSEGVVMNCCRALTYYLNSGF